MRKFAAPAVVAIICALALASPAAGQLSPPLSGDGPEVARQLPAAVPDVTLGAAPTAPTTDDGGAPDAVKVPQQPLAPAPQPYVAAPTEASLAQASPTGAQEPAPPEPSSIPPLLAPEAELAAPKSPGAEAPPPEAHTAEALTPEALVPDSNSSQINAVFTAINSYRASLGLAAVKYHATVAGMAQEWSNSIASREVIEHRANFWTDPRALNPNNGAGEVIAVRWDRDAAQLVEWWKSSPAHNAVLKDPRFNVVGIGVTFTDGNWQTTPNRYTMWGVVNFFGYSTLPSGTTTSPGGSVNVPAPSPSPPATVCDPRERHMPPTLDLTSAAIKSAGDLVSVGSSGELFNRPLRGPLSYGAPQLIGSGFGSAKEVFITDWDRDGAFDVLTQWNDGRLTLHPGRATGGFKGAITLGSSAWQWMTVSVGTWCGNNRLPQIVAADSAGKLWLYSNAGMAPIAVRTEIGSGVAANKLSMVDYNADGFQDLLAVEGNGSLRLYRGGGSPAPRQETRPVVGFGWTDYTGLRTLRDVTGLNSTGIAGLDRNGTVEYWDLNSGKLTVPAVVGTGWAGQRLAQ